MRGSRNQRKVVSKNSGSPYRCVVTSNLPSSPRSVWLVNDDGHPKSPLSIERMPRLPKKNISKVARVKPCKVMARKRKAPPEDTLAFFIDKSPNETQFAVMQNQGRQILNESVTILDSPRPANELHLEWPAQTTRRQDSVDTVDLCSEEEVEHESITKGTKRRMRKKRMLEKNRNGMPEKRRKLCIEAIADQEPDIIVLDDDDDESTGKCKNNASIIVESMRVKASNSSRCREKSPATSSLSGLCETTSLGVTRGGPFSRQNTNFWSKCVDKPEINQVPKDRFLSGSAPSDPTRNIYTEGNSAKLDLAGTVGSNVFNPCGNMQQIGLRPIIIDGCNVAIAHGGNRTFSVRGLCICVEYFVRRGHSQVVALVPLHQRSKVSPQDRDVLESLRNDSHLVFTPSRFIENRLISSYDDRYIVQYAAAVGGVIVSRDNYRDLLPENPAWRDTITNRLLMPTWVGDILMFPVDPLGRSGPSLDDFLRFPSK